MSLQCVCLGCRGVLLPAEELWVGQDLLQPVVVTDAEGEDGLGRLAGKVPGDARRERQNDLPGDLHHTPGTRHRVMETLFNTLHLTPAQSSTLPYTSDVAHPCLCGTE